MKYNISFDKPLYIKCIFSRSFVNHEGSGSEYHVTEGIYIRIFSQPSVKTYQIATHRMQYSSSYVLQKLKQCSCNFKEIYQYKIEAARIYRIVTRLIIQPDHYFDTLGGIVSSYWKIFDDVYIRYNIDIPQDNLIIVSKTKNYSKEEILNKFEELLINQL